MEVDEGGVTVSVPGLATDGIPDGVFYNPRQELNRDITIATLRAYREREPGIRTYLDAMTASGIRGVRAAADGLTVTCCDRDPEATELCSRNLERNGLTATVRTENVNALLHQRTFDVVDIDPFGSPIPFADAAIAGTNHLLCVTATDTAPLCGAHFRAGIRRYSAVPRRTAYHREMGLRVLLSALCRTAARYDVAIEPVLSHVDGHSVRTYLALSDGAQAADATIDTLGTLWHCPECLHRETEPGLLGWRQSECPSCGGTHVVSAGPLWLGRPHDPAFVRSAAEHLDEGMGTADRARRLLERIEDELDRPTHYDQHVLCKRWNQPAPPMDEFLQALESEGYSASRTHYGGTTFKTDAGIRDIEAVIRG